MQSETGKVSSVFKERGEQSQQLLTLEQDANSNQSLTLNVHRYTDNGDRDSRFTRV